MSGRELSVEMTAKLCKKLGLPADASSEAIGDALDARLVANAASEAIRSGRILAAHRDYWEAALRTDWKGTKNVLASLAPKNAAPVRSVAAAAAVLGAPRAIPVSEQTMSDAKADAELWAMGYRDGVEAPPKPGWWEIAPPKEV